MMFSDKESVVGLDIGTSKVTAIVAAPDPEAGVRVTGIGQSISRGVRKGEIMDADLTAEDIHAALTEAEERSDEEIRSVYLGVTGAHLRSLINRGTHPVVSPERDITDEDVRDVVRNAKAVNIPHDHHILHVVRQQFLIDGESRVQNPVGLTGTRLEVDIHVVHGHYNRLQNPINLVRKHRIEVEEVVFAGLATMVSVLSPRQKQLGTLVLDFGGGTIDYSLCYEGILRHSGALPVAGDHISHDLSHGLKVSLGRAESLKIEHGSALCGARDPDRIVQVRDRGSRRETSIPLDTLERIMSQRIQEALELVDRDLERAGCREMVQNEVVIAGGGARIRDILAMAEQIFGVPAIQGQARDVAGPPEVLRQPEFAMAIGLAKYGINERRSRQRSGSQGRILRAVHRLVRWW